MLVIMSHIYNNGYMKSQIKESKISRGRYVYIHEWLKINYGKADKCEVKCFYDKGEKKELAKHMTLHSESFYWAKLKDKPYDTDINNFIKLCGICHQNYDRGTLKMDLKPTRDHYKYISLRASKTIQKYLNELCIESGENKSKVITRLITEAYTNLKKPQK